MLHGLYGAVLSSCTKRSAPLAPSTAKLATLLLSWLPTTSQAPSHTSLKLRGTRPRVDACPVCLKDLGDGATALVDEMLRP